MIWLIELGCLVEPWMMGPGKVASQDIFPVLDRPLFLGYNEEASVGA